MKKFVPLVSLLFIVTTGFCQVNGYAKITGILGPVLNIANPNETYDQFNIGDKVLLYDPTTKVGLSRKLTIRWKGPYTIIQKRNSINYVINIDGKMSLVNKHRLRPYVHNDNNESKYDNDIVLLQEEVEERSTGLDFIHVIKLFIHSSLGIIDTCIRTHSIYT